MFERFSASQWSGFNFQEHIVNFWKLIKDMRVWWLYLVNSVLNMWAMLKKKIFYFFYPDVDRDFVVFFHPFLCQTKCTYSHWYYGLYSFSQFLLLDLCNLSYHYYYYYFRRRKEIIKSTETPEEKRARRLSKKVFGFCFCDLPNFLLDHY